MNQPRSADGRYAFDGNWDRLCTCGHTLGIHYADPPQACMNAQKSAGGTGEPCDCKKFVPAPPQGDGAHG